MKLSNYKRFQNLNREFTQAMEAYQAYEGRKESLHRMWEEASDRYRPGLIHEMERHFEAGISLGLEVQR